MLGHSRFPAGITPVATGASHPSAAAATVSNRAATNSAARRGSKPLDEGLLAIGMRRRAVEGIASPMTGFSSVSPRWIISSGLLSTAMPRSWSLLETVPTDVVGTLTVTSAPRFGRQPPEKVPSSRLFAPKWAATLAICRYFTGATGLEPATSGVTGRFEGHADWRRSTLRRSIHPAFGLFAIDFA
jgi:hypothetical protein